MRRFYLTPRRLFHGLVRLFTGEIILTGIGDGGDDRDELVNTFENMAIVMALIMGILYTPFEEAATKAAVLDRNSLGLGSAYVWMQYLNIALAASVTLMSLFVIASLQSVPTRAEATYLISMIRTEIMVPYSLTFFAAFQTISTTFMNAFIRMRCLDVDKVLLLARVADLSQLGPSGETDNATEVENLRRLATATASRAGSKGEHGVPLNEQGPASEIDLLENGRVALWGMLVCTVGMVIVTLFQGSSIFVKQWHARQVFCPKDDAVSAQERAVAGAGVTLGDKGWFASPNAVQLRRYLHEYKHYFDTKGTLGSVASPEHFLEFVLVQERSKGCGDISYLARKMGECEEDPTLQRIPVAHPPRVKAARPFHSREDL